ncbi:CHAT domain-containing protein [Desulfococcaceae bacterium HSG9]|nr:CHAT domain-containing protein [Desulfococcaceae bacterium HSG9]
MEKHKRYADLLKFLEKELKTLDATSYILKDLEGKLYLLDDIADLYTYQLVNFEKAQQYNAKVKTVYEAIYKIGVNNLPVSMYFNNRRSLYYTFFEGIGDFQACSSSIAFNYMTGSMGALKFCAGGFENYNFRQYPGHPDFWTPFSDEFIRLTREKDFQTIGKRIKEREKFIINQLFQPPHKLEISSRHTVAYNQKLIGQLQRFLDESVKDYSRFEHFVLQTEAAMKDYGIVSDTTKNRDKIISSSKKALRNKPSDINIETQKKINLLHYWLALNYLSQSDFDKGLAHHKHLLTGIDLLEDFILKKHDYRVKQLKTITKSLATKSKVFKALSIALEIVYLGFSFAGQIRFSGEYADKWAEFLGEAASLPAKAAFNYELENNSNANLTNQASLFISPYLIKLGRYLDKYEMVEYLFKVGEGYENTNNPQKAIKQYEEAIRIIERQRSTISVETQRISFFATKQQLYNRLIPLLISVGKKEKALELVERSKSRAFVDLLGSEQVQLKTDEQTQIYRKRVGKLAEFDTLLSEKALSPQQLEYLINNIQRGLIVSKTVAKPIKKAAPKNSDLEIHSLATVQALTAKEMQELVDPETAIAEYFLTDDAIIIFLIQHEGIEVFAQPVEAKLFLKNFAALRKSILERKKRPDYAEYFYKMLIGPIERQVTGSQLVIVPHKALHYMPFQALYNKSEYLIERFAISYAPSISALKLIIQKSFSQNQRALIIGNPTGDLTFAEDEALSISKILPNSRLLIGGQATESILKHESHNYQYIHLATHGVYNVNNPLKSKILLAQDSSNDGSLTVAELFAVDWQPSLVTLSACRTGLSKYISGDELIGLQRAIFFAGAKSIVASLWSVDDKATGFLMHRFYENLAKMPKNRALQKAQVETMQRFEMPFYWASFNLIGTKI